MEKTNVETFKNTLNVKTEEEDTGIVDNGDQKVCKATSMTKGAHFTQMLDILKRML